uniref:Uncharacterized protein n=1 Tax=Strigamia maritima TaxID=126957 RepID=T1JGB4_STRMM
MLNSRLIHEGFFSGSVIDKECIRFCFMSLVQAELNEIKKIWNSHTIRKTKNANSPSGRPLAMYMMPQVYNTKDYKCEVNIDEVDVCSEECIFRSTPCDPIVYELAHNLMAEHNYTTPPDCTEAVNFINFNNFNSIKKPKPREQVHKWREQVHKWREQVHKWREQVHKWREQVHKWREQVHKWREQVHNWWEQVATRRIDTWPQEGFKEKLHGCWFMRETTCVQLGSFCNHSNLCRENLKLISKNLSFSIENMTQLDRQQLVVPRVTQIQNASILHFAKFLLLL